MVQQETLAPAEPAVPDHHAPARPAGTGRATRSGRLRRLGRWPEALAVCVVGQLLPFAYLPALRDRHQTFFQDVLVNAMGPDRHGMARLWQSGVLPTWVRSQYGGEPYLANVQHGVLYPGNLPFWVLDTSTALDVVIATHLALAFVGMWAYCRIGLRLGGWAALLGAVAFAYSGNVLQHTVLGDQFQVVCLVPLVVLAAHLALHRGGLGRTVLAAVAIGVQFLAGHPEQWLYTVAGLALYGVAWVLLAGPVATLPRRAWAATLRLGGAVALFVLLFAWQLLPTLLLAGQGYRTSPSFREQYPLPRQSAINALLPDFGRILVGENVAFVGTAALCLVGLGLLARRLDLRWVRAWVLVAGGLAFVMALGPGTGLYRHLYDEVGLVRSFRVPSRSLLLTTFALATAAAIGLDELLGAHVGRLRARLAQGGAAVAVLLAGLGGVALVGHLAGDGRSWRWWMLSGAVGLAAWAAAGWRRVPRAPVALTLILLTALELGHARPFAEYRQKAPNLLYDDYGPVLRRLGIDDGRYVSVAGTPANPRQRDTIPVPAGMSGLTRDYYLAGAATRVAATPGTPLAVGAQTVVGRDGGFLPLRRYREFYDAAAGGGGNLADGAVFAPPSSWDWDTLDYLGVRWFLSSDDLPEAERSVLDAKGFRLAARYAYVLVWRRPPRPLARLVHAVDVVPDRAARLARLAARYPLDRRAIVERPVGLDPPPPAGAETVRTTHLGQRSVELETSSPARSLLTLADPWYPQWRVSIDGKPARPLPVDHAFRGVVVPAGTHRVRFSYQDDRLRLGLLLAGLTLAGLAAAAVVPRLRRRRARAPRRGGE